MKSKRYSILNFYIRGSNVTPQVCHGLNRLWANKATMTPAADALFSEWVDTSETEVILQGGNHKDLEELYLALSSINTLPSAKFNEGQDDLCGSCTVVTFVASDRIVAAGDYLRSNRITPAEAFDVLTKTSILLNEQTIVLNSFEAFVASKIAYLPLVA
jgi:peptidyl-tRNA hydrolase